MNQHALMVVADEPGTFHWVLLKIDGQVATSHSQSECAFEDYESALNAGTLALAAVDEQPYENEAADPVGDADCAE